MLCSCATNSSTSQVSPNSEITTLPRTETENNGESSISAEIANPTEDDHDESSEQSESDIEDDHEFKPNYIVQMGKHKSLIVTTPNLHWKDYEEKLPLPILRATSDEDLITKLESTLKSNCEIRQPQSASGYIAQSIYCATKCDDDGECIADLYVSLKSPKDNVTRVYDISKHRIADSVVSRDDMYIRDNTELKDIAVFPFLDTEAVYARFAETDTLANEHYSGGESKSNETVTIYLFAGDKLRLAGQWTDYTSETFSSYERFNSEDGEEILEENSHTSYTTNWATFDGEKISENEEHVDNSQALQARIKDHLDSLSRAKSTNPELQIAPNDITKFLKE